MFSISIEVEPENQKSLESAGAPASPDTHTQLLEALTEWWVLKAAEPYANLNINEKLYPITIPWRFLETEISFEVPFDIDLLENLLEIYAALGWSALEKIESTLKPLPQAKQSTKHFFRVTMNVISVMVAHGLVELERQAAAYAQEQWTAARYKITEYLTAFKNVGFNTTRYVLIDRKLADELFELCRKYAVEAKKARHLQEKIDERNRKNPPKWRQKGSGQELWFEVFAGPQREVLNKMADLTNKILAKFPAAVIVLDQLPDSILGADSLYDKKKAQDDLEGMIGSTLDNLLGDLQTLNDSLKMPGVTQELAKQLKPIMAEPRDFSRLATLKIPQNGFEQTVIDTVFEREKIEPVGLYGYVRVPPLKVSRLLANLELLMSYYDKPDGVEPGGWSQVVLFQYCVRLADVIDEKKQDEVFWDQYWGWIGRVTALLGLIALMAIFPFGVATAPAALAALLTLCGSISVILGVLTLLHDLFGTLEKAGKLEAEARDKFFRLGQTNPEAVIEIGELLSRSDALREAVAKGLLVSVLSLAAGRILKPVAVALNFQGYAQDVETLFTPVAADG